MNRLIQAAVVLAVTGAAVLGGPLAANAASYTPETPTVTGAAAAQVTGSASPGATFTVHFKAIFQINHDLTVYFFSTGDVPTSIADFRAAESPALTTVTDGTGSADVTAVTPADASAPITVEATDGTTTAAITIPVEAAAAAVATTASGATPLATTGTYVSLATIWGAVGLVILGAAFVGIRAYRNRNRTATTGVHRM